MTRYGSAPGKNAYLDAVEKNSTLLAEAARLGLEAPVPTCPGWSVAFLVAHIGEVQRFWAHQVVTRSPTPADLPKEAFDSCPGLLAWYEKAQNGSSDLGAIPDGLVEWFEAATVELVNAFRTFGLEETAWHWSGDNRAITHMRNQAMEAVVHRWDAQNAHGTTTPIDPVIAVDGIDQHFYVQVPAARQWGKPIDGSGERYHFHRTDGDGEWTVVFTGSDVAIAHEHADADVTISGTVEDIFLWLWGRLPGERLHVQGDVALVNRYRALVPASA